MPSFPIEPLYLKLRERAFSWRDPKAPPGYPCAVILETSYPQGAFTLVCTSEGSVSLYYSNGGGTLGMGDKAGPKTAAAQLARQAVRFKDTMPAVTDKPIPEIGEARLYILVGGEIRGVAAAERDFGENKLSVSPLFHAAHHVISEISKITPV